MDTVFNRNLPDKYYFVDKTTINPDEVIKLRISVGWDGGSPERWAKCIEQSLAIVGVRDVKSELVGIAFLAGNLRHAVLCDLTVDSKHQHKGIGGAIMAEIIRTIKSLNIPFIYTELADTNPFREKMLLVGFKMTGNSLFREPFDI